MRTAELANRALRAQMSEAATAFRAALATTQGFLAQGGSPVLHDACLCRVDCVSQAGPLACCHSCDACSRAGSLGACQTTLDSNIPQQLLRLVVLRAAFGGFSRTFLHRCESSADVDGEVDEEVEAVASQAVDLILPQRGTSSSQQSRDGTAAVAVAALPDARASNDGEAAGDSAMSEAAGDAATLQVGCRFFRAAGRKYWHSCQLPASSASCRAGGHSGQCAPACIAGRT